MDAYEVPGQRTALREYLLRAVEHVMGKPARMMSAPGVPITQIGALFELLNISMTPSQLQWLPMAAQTRHRDCLHFASVPRVRTRTHEDLSESTVFSIDDLHWCVLQSLQSPGRAHPHLRKLIEPFADKSGTCLYVPLAKLEAVWRSLQREELPASIRALASELVKGESFMGPAPRASRRRCVLRGPGRRKESRVGARRAPTTSRHTVAAFAAVGTATEGSAAARAAGVRARQQLQGGGRALARGSCSGCCSRGPTTSSTQRTRPSASR